MKYRIVNCPHCGKIIPDYLLKGELNQKVIASCPQCKSQKTCKNGKRHTPQGEIQLYLCRFCGYKFSERPSNTPKFSHIMNLHPKTERS